MSVLGKAAKINEQQEAMEATINLGSLPEEQPKALASQRARTPPVPIVTGVLGVRSNVNTSPTTPRNSAAYNLRAYIQAKNPNGLNYCLLSDYKKNCCGDNLCEGKHIRECETVEEVWAIHAISLQVDAKTLVNQAKRAIGLSTPRGDRSLTPRGERPSTPRSARPPPPQNDGTQPSVTDLDPIEKLKMQVAARQAQAANASQILERVQTKGLTHVNAARYLTPSNSLSICQSQIFFIQNKQMMTKFNQFMQNPPLPPAASST